MSHNSLSIVIQEAYITLHGIAFYILLRGTDNISKHAFSAFDLYFILVGHRA